MPILRFGDSKIAPRFRACVIIFSIQKGEKIMEYSKQKSFTVKATAMIMILLAAIVLLANTTVFAEEQHVAEYFDEDMLDDLSSYPVLVATEGQYALYAEELDGYVEDGGQLLVTATSGNNLGTRYYFDGEEIQAVPVMALTENEEIVDSSGIDFLSVADDFALLPATRTSSVNAGNMWLGVNYLVYANNFENHIALAGIYTYVDYFESMYYGVRYYNVYAEVSFMPTTGRYRIDSFDVNFNALTEGDLTVESRTVNHNLSGSSITSISHNMGSRAASELYPGTPTTYSYDSYIGFDITHVAMAGGTPVNADTDGDGVVDQIKSAYQVVTSKSYGRAYTTLFVHTYRTANSKPAGYYIDVRSLKISGYLQPDFEESNKDMTIIAGTWQYPFNNKSYIVMYTDDSDSNTSDYFDGFAFVSGLPGQGSLNGVAIFEEE